MVKLFTILSTLVLLVLGWLHPGGKDLEVQPEVPERISPGESFVVTLHIKRGSASGFARLQQILPAGFSAEAMETSGAEFMSEEQDLKFIWVKLPTDEEFSISYKVQSPAGYSGLNVINGVIIYLDEEQTKQLALPPLEINIGVQNTTYNSTVPVVERKLIVTAPDRNEYRVELSFSQQGDAGRASFVDEIPEGFEAIPLKTNGAVFTFADGKAIFSWDDFPKEEAFSIAYTVYSNKVKTAPTIEGMLLYNESLADLPFTTTGKDDDSIAENIVDEFLAGENDKNNIKVASAKIPPVPPAVTSFTNEIQFKVQICATIKSPARDNAWFGKHYRMQEEVLLSHEEGWKKYLIGQFGNYKEASALRKKTIVRVPDAFVVAYERGVRIPLKDALNRKSL